MSEVKSMCDYSELKKELINQLDLFKNTKDTDCKLSIYEFVCSYADYITFLSFSEDKTEKQIYDKYLKMIGSSIFSSFRRKMKKYKKEYTNNLDHDQEKIKYILNEINKKIENTDLCLSQYSINCHLHEAIILDIINSYYKENDSDMLELFESVLSNKHLLALPDCTRTYSGTTITSKTINLGYINIERTMDFKMLLTIIHEMAHLKYISDMNKNVNYETSNKYRFLNNLIEVPAYIEEKKFLNYLIKNGICSDCAINKYEMNLLNYSYFLKYFNSDIVTYSRMIYGEIFSNMILNGNCTDIDYGQDCFLSISNYNINDVVNSIDYVIENIKNEEKKGKQKTMNIRYM